MNAKVFFVLLAAAFVAIGALYYPAIRGFVSGVAPLFQSPPSFSEDDPLPFEVPEGFAVSVFASSTPGARVLARDPMGTLVVSLTSAGAVVALPDNNSDQRADRVVPILSGLNGPHGILFRCEPDSAGGCVFMLYVAEPGFVRSYTYNPFSLSAELKETVATLPTKGGGHYTRTLYETPEGKVLVSVGSSCNVCAEDDPNRAAVLSLDVVNKTIEPFARGLRNTVFLTTNPIDGSIWGTDMGRDLLGDDTPPDEVNIIAKGGNYGWPTCFGKNLHDTDFDKNIYIRNPCMEPFETPSHIDIPAHSAPLGLAFVPEEGWPESMRLDLLVAYHGSWNRSVPTGYKIVRIELDEQSNPTGNTEDFMTGFLKDGTVFGRPADIMLMPGGTAYVSDDHTGVVYRVYRTHE